MSILKKPYILLVIVVILAFAFYWYELRPSMIRKECAFRAYDKPVESSWDELIARTDWQYEACLHLKGLK